MKTIFSKMLFAVFLGGFLLLLLSFTHRIVIASNPSAALPPGFQVFPSNNIWNTPVDTARVHPNSAQWMEIINGHSGHPLHPDFGTTYQGRLNGIPYNVVGNATPKVLVAFNPGGNYAEESDPLPPEGLPIPPDAVAEGDPPPVDPAGDRHLILVDVDNKVLHEMYAASRQPDGSWLCTQYSRWDLTSNALRPEGWTSSEAAGLPLFPGLVRWDEIQTGEITHALRFTLSLTWKPHLWPARHDAPTGSTNNPPMGMRVRLKANFDISHYSATNQIILRALKKYGMFLADNGGDWFISGAPNANFDDSDLHYLVQIVPNSAFEVVDTRSWMIDSNSASSKTPPSSIDSYVSGGVLAVHVYPNPWRPDRGYARQVTFENLPDTTTVRIFTVSGHFVKSPPASGSTAIWDLTNESGDRVASGLYIYVVKTADGRSARGKFAILK